MRLAIYRVRLELVFHHKVQTLAFWDYRLDRGTKPSKKIVKIFIIRSTNAILLNERDYNI